MLWLLATAHAAPTLDPELFVVRDQGGLVVVPVKELTFEEHPSLLGDTDLTPAQLATLEVEPATTWWVLPASGPAVQADLVGYRVIDILPDSRVVAARLAPRGLAASTVVVARKAAQPPSTWIEDAGAATRPTPEAALEAAQRWSDRHVSAGTPRAVYPDGDGLRVRMAWAGGPRVETIEGWEQAAPFVELRVGPDLEPILVDVGHIDPNDPEVPLTRRDVDGDGVPDMVTSACADTVVSGTGPVLARGPYSCWGC